MELVAVSMDEVEGVYENAKLSVVRIFAQMGIWQCREMFIIHFQ